MTQELVHIKLTTRFHYEEKTGNEWGTPFEKLAGKMYRLDLDYGPGEEETETVKPGSLTKLHPGLFNCPLCSSISFLSYLIQAL